MGTNVVKGAPHMSLSLFSLFFGTMSLTEPDAHHTIWIWRNLPVSASPNAGVKNAQHMLACILGFELRSSCFHSKHFYPQSHFPSPIYTVLKSIRTRLIAIPSRHLQQFKWHVTLIHCWHCSLFSSDHRYTNYIISSSLVLPRNEKKLSNRLKLPCQLNL